MDKPLKSLTIFVAVILAVTTPLLTQKSVAAEKNPDKYKELFYPNGMPTKKGHFGRGPTVYKYHGETEIPEKKLLFVLYSEKIEDGRTSSDQKHTTFLSTINKTDSDLTIISTTDVTKYISVEMECRGCFEWMNGTLDIIPLKNDMKILHLSITGELSGTGFISSCSDVFFRVDSTANNLIPALQLSDTTTYGRSGMGQEEYSNTFLYMQRDESIGTKILTQNSTYKRDQSENIDSKVLDPDINVYQYNFNNDKFELTDKISTIPSDAAAIKKVFEIGMETRSVQ